MTDGALEGSFSPQITAAGAVISGSWSFRSGRPAAMRSRQATPSGRWAWIQPVNWRMKRGARLMVESPGCGSAKCITGSTVCSVSQMSAMRRRLARETAESASAFVSHKASPATASGCRRWMSSTR